MRCGLLAASAYQLKMHLKARTADCHTASSLQQWLPRVACASTWCTYSPHADGGSSCAPCSRSPQGST